MSGMSPLRFMLILLLTVALDLSPLPPPHATWEVAEEFEEVAHPQRGRRPFRLVRDTVAPAVAHETRTAELQHARPLPPAPLRPVATVLLNRKLPPSLAEPSSAPDAH
jgi:hypothetical protein